MSGGSRDRNNGALKVVDVAILSWVENIESYYSRNLQR